MFNPFAANSLRNAILGLGAFAALATATPSVAGGYLGEDEVIYAGESWRGDWREGRRHVRPAPVYEDFDLIPARQITRQLRRAGYGTVREIALRGDQYRVVAVRNNGALVKLRVDAYSGEILSVRRIGWVGSSVRPVPHFRDREPGYSIQFGWSSD